MTAKSQLGAATESAYGTYTAPTKFYEFTGEGLTWNEERIESAAWRAGERVISSSRWRPGAISVGGNIDMEVASKGFGFWFYHALGSGVMGTPGTATARTQTFTLGDLVDKSMTIQVGIEDRGGTAYPFNFVGCKVQSFTFRCAVGELVTVSAAILGQDLDVVEALGTASYPATPQLMSFVDGELTIAGGTVNVRNFDMVIDNRLAADHIFGSGLTREPMEPALRAITGSFEADFVGLDEFNRFYNGTEATLVATFDTGVAIEGVINYKTVLTANVRYDGDTPSIAGPEAVNLPIRYAVTAPAAGTTVQIDYTTTDTDFV